MSAEEIRQRAIDRAKPPERPSAPLPESEGLLNRAHWDLFNLADLFQKVWPHIQFFEQPVERWPRTRYRDWVQWALAIKVGEEYVGEIQKMWEDMKTEHDQIHAAMVTAQKGGRSP